MTLHDSPGGLNTANNKGWAFDSTSTSTSTSTTTYVTTTSASSTSSTSTSTLPPYTNKVISGFGVNYKNAQSLWSADMAYFNSIGLKYIRPNLKAISYPWSAGTSDGNGNFAFWRLCAQTFANAGFWVTWGPSGLAGVSRTNFPYGNFTATAWTQYASAVVSEATYLQQQGIVLGDFELGNELELFVDNTTLTVQQLVLNLQSLAAQVKQVYNLSPISYGSTVNGNNINTYWFQYGLGALDTLSLHPYGTANVSSNTITIGASFTLLSQYISEFGSNKIYVSEFNLDPTENPTIVQNITVNTQLTTMQNILSNYLLANNINKFLIYLYSVYLNNGSTGEIGLVQYYNTGNYNNSSFNPLWFLFFSQLSSMVPKLTAGEQSINNSPLGSNPTALVDDPVYLVDDPNILVGSQVSNIPDIKISASDNAPNISIRGRS